MEPSFCTTTIKFRLIKLIKVMTEFYSWNLSKRCRLQFFDQVGVLVVTYYLIYLNIGWSQCAVCSNRGLLYIFGGTDSWSCSSTVEVYDPNTNKWSFLPQMSQARHGAAAIIFKGKETFLVLFVFQPSTVRH